jgi:hypothetical protein
MGACFVLPAFQLAESKACSSSWHLPAHGRDERIRVQDLYVDLEFYDQPLKSFHEKAG